MSGEDWLVGDIGGTHTRLALASANGWSLRAVEELRNADYASLEDALHSYLQRSDASPNYGCLAVACPVTGDSVQLTNHAWQFSQRELGDALELTSLTAVNDFTALAMGVQQLAPSEITQLGGEAGFPNAAIGVLGAGTGLGVSGLVWSGSGWVPISGEGGHASLAPYDAEEIEILRLGQKEFGGHCSAERILSGAGLEFLGRAMMQVRGIKAKPLTASAITAQAVADTHSFAYQVAMRFLGILGGVAGDLALTLGARGGVYIAGGIVPRLSALVPVSPLRERFEAKGRFGSYLRPIPLFLVKSGARAALLGAAAILRAEYGEAV